MKRQGILSRLKNLDQFPQQVTLNYDGGMAKYKTYSGMVLTIAGLLSVFIFGLR